MTTNKRKQNGRDQQVSSPQVSQSDSSPTKIDNSDNYTPFTVMKGKNSKPKKAVAGCLTCRQRHKRCTRERPVCKTCNETGYTCFWREPCTKFVDYNVKLIRSSNPNAVVLKPNKKINFEENILSNYKMTDFEDEVELDVASDHTKESTSDNDVFFDATDAFDDEMIYVAQQAVSFTNAYIERQNSMTDGSGSIAERDEKMSEDEDEEKESEDEEDNDADTIRVKKEDSDSDDGDAGFNNGSNNSDNDNGLPHIKKEPEDDDGYENQSVYTDTSSITGTRNRVLNDRLNDLMGDENVDTIVNEVTHIAGSDKISNSNLSPWFKKYLADQESSSIDNVTISATVTETFIPLSQVSQPKESPDIPKKNPARKRPTRRISRRISKQAEPVSKPVESLALVPFGFSHNATLEPQSSQYNSRRDQMDDPFADVLNGPMRPEDPLDRLLGSAFDFSSRRKLQPKKTAKPKFVPVQDDLEDPNSPDLAGSIDDKFESTFDSTDLHHSPSLKNTPEPIRVHQTKTICKEGRIITTTMNDFPKVSNLALQKIKKINAVAKKLSEKQPKKSTEKVTPILDRVLADAVKSQALIKPTSMLQNAARISKEQTKIIRGVRESKQLFSKTKDVRSEGKINKEDAALLLFSTVNSKKKNPTSKAVSKKMISDRRRKFATVTPEPHPPANPV